MGFQRVQRLLSGAGDLNLILEASKSWKIQNLLLNMEWNGVSFSAIIILQIYNF